MNLRTLGLAALVLWWLITNPTTGQGLDGSSTPYAELFQTVGVRHGVDAELLAAIGYCESRYNPDARSPAGAQGLMQFMPATAAAYRVDPWDPASAIDGAARYLADSVTELATSDPALLAASYNAGRGAVARHDGVPPYAETRRYVDCVTNRL